MYDIASLLIVFFMAFPTGPLADMGISFNAFARSLSEKCCSANSKLPLDFQLLLLRNVLKIYLYAGSLLIWVGFRTETNNTGWVEPEVLTKIVVSVVFIGMGQAFWYCVGDFKNHPCLKNLRYVYIILKDSDRLENSDSNTAGSSSSINTNSFSSFLTAILTEYNTPVSQLWHSTQIRDNIDQLTITNNFILKTTKHPFTFNPMIVLPIEQNSTTAVCTSSIYVQNADHSSGSEQNQLLTFDFKTPKFKHSPKMVIRMSTNSFSENFEDSFSALGIVVVFLPEIAVDATVFQQFLQAWREQISLNRKKLVGEENDIVETCLACQSQDANVWMGGGCSCTRAVWCDGCLARTWLTYKQRKQKMITDWLLEKENCPICRNLFGLSDISYLEIQQ